MHMAIIRGDEEIVKILLTCGVDTEYKVYNKWSLPLYAIIIGKYNLLDLMLEAGFDIDYEQQELESDF